jgi:plastocyanin
MQRREFLWTSTLGAAGGAASGSALAQESSPTPTEGDDGGDSGGTSHTVEMNDSLAFVPQEITIAPGDTVVWENVGSVGHSVTAYEDELPEGAAYWASGGFDAEGAARDAYSAGDPESGDVPGGESYEHTFETTGEYGYFCIPHEAAGMVGTVVVQEGGGQAAGGGGGGEQEPHEMGVPFQAHYVGIATLLAIMLTLVFTFFVLKYGESPHASGRND